MSNRRIGSRLRRLCAMAALPAAGVVLGFAPAAHAANNPPCVASSTATLVSCVATANGATGLTVIQLTAGTTYLPTATMTFNPNVDVEITGPPQVTASATSETVISGSSFLNHQTDMFDLSSGDNVLFKAFGITQAASTAGGVGINNNGGNLELDNFVMFSVNGGAITNGGNLVLNNTSVIENDSTGIVQNSGSVSVNNSTISGNHTDGVLINAGSFTTDNAIISNNAPDCAGPTGPGTAPPTDIHNNGDDTDGSCFLSGSNTSPQAGNDPGFATSASFNGGPTLTLPPAAGNVANTAGVGCLADDQRFEVGATSCALGAYQSTAHTLTDTTPPTCTVKSINESTTAGTPSTEVVAVNDNTGGLGLGADVIQGFTIVNSNEATFGSNGTVSWPVRGSTMFAMTDPGVASTDASETSNVTNSEFDVTAAKPVADLGTQHDTTWSFTATDWFGNSKLCQ
jgi:hypothetical protein